MKRNRIVWCCLFVLVLLYSFKDKSSTKDKVLIFSKTLGYRHASIKEGIEAIKLMGQKNGFDVDTTESAEKFTDENLKNYKALIFLSPTGSNLFNDEQKETLKNYIRHGGGFVGIHAATDCNYEWEWYGKMVGAFFTSHPAIQKANMIVISKNHPATRKLPDTWQHTDEWYNFKDINKDIKVLVRVDENSYQGGKNGNFHPVTWYHNFEGGRVFYTAVGHTAEDYTSDKLFLNQLLGGIQYALGRKK